MKIIKKYGKLQIVITKEDRKAVIDENKIKYEALSQEEKKIFNKNKHS